MEHQSSSSGSSVYSAKLQELEFLDVHPSLSNQINTTSATTIARPSNPSSPTNSSTERGQRIPKRVLHLTRGTMVKKEDSDAAPITVAAATTATQLNSSSRDDEIEVVRIDTMEQLKNDDPKAREEKEQQSQQQQQRPSSQSKSQAPPPPPPPLSVDSDHLDTVGGNNDNNNLPAEDDDPRNVGNARDPSFRVDWSMEYLNLRHQRYLFREFLDFYNQIRYNCGMFVNNGHVQFLIIVLIAVNALMMGIGTFEFVTEDEYVNNIFETVDQVFLIIFTVELGLQFVYHGWRLILDGWLVFDLVIITTSWAFQSVQIIRAFRIFRALRLVTRIKIMKNLILALFGVMPRMAAIGLMLFLIFYIFAVMFTQLFKDLYKDGKTDHKYFERIDDTFFTLFQIMTLDAWAEIARQVIHVYKWAWLPFISFVIISGFIVVNLIIAVICDAIAALHKDDKAKIHGTYGEGENNTDSDGESSQQLEIREQLDSLEEQMEELTRIQAKTFHTLQYLTRQLQMHKLKQELKMAPPKSAVAK